MISLFFAGHWGLSVLMQSLFQHRYAAHRMYTMGPKTERSLHLLTALVQGSSYLEPRAYAILHREHHAFADTERDPHSPAHHGNPARMMLATARRYAGFVTRRGQYALLPLHFVMGPVHGAIVNWCGHRYGYRNFRTRDESRNSLPVDALCMGELFQNNHHARPANPDFASRRFELDPTWQVMRLLARLKLIRIAHVPRAHEAVAVEEGPGTPHALPSVTTLPVIPRRAVADVAAAAP